MFYRVCSCHDFKFSLVMWTSFVEPMTTFRPHKWNHFLDMLMGVQHLSNLEIFCVYAQVLCCVDKQGILSWPNPSPETVLFFSGRVEPPHNSQDDLRDDLSVNSYCRMETDDDREEVSVRGCFSDSL